MTLARFIRPWSADVYRHIPEGSPYSVLDFRFAGHGVGNRWNEPGEPTLYLASDVGTATAEFARHIRHDYHPDLHHAPLRRRLFRLRVQFDLVLDFCTPGAWQALGGLSDAPNCFLDKTICRAIARYVRVATAAVAMRVPSVAFLDDRDRWSLVVFLEKVPGDPSAYITNVADVGLIHVGP